MLITVVLVLVTLLSFLAVLLRDNIPTDELNRVRLQSNLGSSTSSATSVDTLHVLAQEQFNSYSNL